MIGTALSAIFILLATAWPHLQLVEPEEDVSNARSSKFLYINQSTLTYPTVGKITNVMSKSEGCQITVDMKLVHVIDSSAALAIIDLVQDTPGSKLINLNVKVKKILIEYGYKEDTETVIENLNFDDTI